MTPAMHTFTHSMSYDTSGLSDRPYPGRSIATTRKPASASGASWLRHEYQISGNPWQSSTSGPVPCSTK